MNLPAMLAAIGVGLASLSVGCAPNQSLSDTEAASGQLRVGLDDYHIRLPAKAIDPGPVRLEVHNVGADQHDLRIDTAGQKVATTRRLRQGEEATLTVDIPSDAEEVTLWCTVPGHRNQGMSATLSVQEAARSENGSAEQ